MAVWVPATAPGESEGRLQDALWLLADEGLVQLDPADLVRVVSRLDCDADCSAAVDDPRRRVWLLGPERLERRGFDGEVLSEMTMAARALASDRLAVGPADGRLWLLEPAALSAVDPRGTVLGRFPLEVDGRRLLLDAAADLLWVVGRDRVVAHDAGLAIPLQELERTGRGRIVTAALDRRHQEIWLATASAIERYSYAGLELETHGVAGVRALRHDGASTWWAITPEGVVALATDGSTSPAPGMLGGRAWIDLVVKGDRLWATDGHLVVAMDAEGRLLGVSEGWPGIRRLFFSPADNVPPVIEISSPRQGERHADGRVRLELEIEDTGVGVDWTTLRVELEGAATAFDCQPATARDALCHPRHRLAAGQWTVAVGVDDRAGNRSETVRRSFGVGAGGGRPSAGAPASPQSPTLTTLVATGDTYISHGSKFNNYGGEEELRVEGSGDARSLLRFDLAGVLPSIDTLNAATLRVFVVSNGGNWGKKGRPIGIHRVTTAWTETGATWTCPDDADPSNSSADCAVEWDGGELVKRATNVVTHSNGLAGWVEYDVTTDVAAILAGESDHGWILKRQGGGSGHIGYASRENAGGNPPELVLDYVGQDNTPPTISIDSPTEGLVLADPRPDVALSYSDVGDGIDESSLVVKLNGQTGQFSCTTNPTSATCQPFADLPEGPNTVAATIDDLAGNASDEVSVSFTIDTVSPVVTVTFPPDGLLTRTTPLTATGSVSESSTLTLDGQTVTVQPDLTFAHSVALGEGANALTFVATDDAGNQGTTVVAVTLDTIPPDPVDSGLVTVGDAASGTSLVRGAAGAAEAATTLTATNTRTSDFATTPVAADGSFSVSVPAQAEDVLSLVLTDPAGNASSATSVVVPPDAPLPPPPDPETVATPIDPTVPSDIARDTAFLYQGADPIQTGVAPGTIDARHVVVVRGRLLARDGSPMPSVVVSVLGRPEFGQTMTQADGEYDLAVNGGGFLTFQFERSDLLTAHRAVDLPWRDYVTIDDVVMIPVDAQATPVTAGSGSAQVARGSVQTDADGSRQATVIVPSNTQATMTLADGTQQVLNTLTIRATEYTVGPEGPATMPASLPPTSGYTYAVELSVDEAEAAGAVSVDFSQPVLLYVENFVGFEAGTTVPVGFYERRLGAWDGSDDGLVIDVLSINGGLAELDVDGSGLPADAATLAALGITDEERAQLAGLYAPGQSLWRSSMPHFSVPDLNWPYGPAGTERPPESKDQRSVEDPCLRGGSIIECENQVLHERVPLAGTPFALHYSSERVPGRTKKRSVRITLTEDEVPTGLGSVELEIRVAGTLFRASFPPDPNQEYLFTWDGLDAYGRTVYGSVPADIRVGYTYPIVYYETVSGLSQAWAAAAAAGGASGFNRFTDPDVTLWTTFRRRVMAHDPVTSAMGGWSITAQHFLDRDGETLHLGNGGRRGSIHTVDVLQRVAGDPSNWGFSGDGGPALEATLSNILSMATGPDGRICIADGSRVRCIDKDGIIQTVAGTGAYGQSGDGVPATQATLKSPYALALAPDGTLYIADNGGNTDLIRKVDTDGIITTIATVTGSSAVRGLAVGPDGSLYYPDDGRHIVNRITPSGEIEKVAGTNGVYWPAGDGGPAVLAGVPGPKALAFGPDGSLYIMSRSGKHVRRVRPDGIIERFAGKSNSYCSDPARDIEPALSACLSAINMAVEDDGTVYITRGSAARVIRDGMIYPGPGWKAYRTSGPAAAEGDPAYDAALRDDRGFAMLPNGDLLWGNDLKTVWRVSSAMRGEGAGSVQVPSEDGRLLYLFDLEGRHLATIDSLTGVALYDFQYDAGGLLVGIRDREGDTTTIERDASGKPTAVVSSFGQRTELTLDPNGYIDSITNPAGETVAFTYGPEGLMATMTDARNNQATFLYDSMGHLTSDQDRASGIQQLTRIEDGDLLQVGITSPLGRTTLYESEEVGGGELERRVTDPATNGTTTVWHTNGGRTRAYPDGTVVDYDPEGDPRFGMLAPVPEKVTVTTPGGLVRTTTVNRDATLSDPYDPLSLTALTETTSVDGRTFTRSYDAATNRLTVTSAEGRSALFDLDSLGRVVSTTVGNLEPVTATYDTLGRLETLTQGTGAEQRVVTFGYDSLGRLSSLLDPLSQTTSFTYDAANRVTRQTLPGSEQIGFSYDPSGNLATLTPPDLPPHTFGYTPLDFEASYTPPDVGQGPPGTTTTYDLDRNVTSVTRPGGEVVSFGYDPAGRVDSVTAAVGTTTLTYDGAGRLSSVTAPGAETLSYSYDGPLPITTTWSGTVAGFVTLGYDGSFRLSSENVGGASAVTFDYDDDSLLTRAGGLSITRDAANGFVSATALGVVTTSRAHDGFGETTSDVASVSGGEVYRADYLRDKLGRITRKTEAIQGTTAVWDYTYDPSGRLTQVDKDGVSFGVYTYDDNGNRLTYSGTFGSATGSYDAQDRLLSYDGLTYTYTPAGELATKSSDSATVNYSYDAFGALRAVVLDSGVRIDYVIDGQGRRIGKTVDGVLVQGFLYADQLNPVAELDGSGAVVSRFVYGSRSNVPAYMEKGGATYRLVSDHLGSPRLVIDTATGAIAQRLDYDAFGRILLDTNPGFQPFGFAGGLYDPQTGLVRFGARDYDPEVGRWTAKDPIGFGGGDSNLYGYVVSDPINRVDPLGLARRCSRALAGPGRAVSNLYDGSSPFLQRRNLEPRHQHFWFDDGDNFGFFGDNQVRPDHGHRHSEYTCEGRQYDDETLREAIQNMTPNPGGPYELFGNNCQEWTDRVLQEYERLRWMDTRETGEDPETMFVWNQIVGEG